MDGNHRPYRSGSVCPPVNHARNRRPLRGRPHPQARGHHEDKPAARGEHQRRRAPAHHRGPLGAGAVPRHDLLQQRDIQHPASEAQVRQGSQDALAALEGQGRPLQVQPVRKACQLLRPHRHFARPEHFHFGCRRAAVCRGGNVRARARHELEHRGVQEIRALRRLPARRVHRAPGQQEDTRHGNSARRNTRHVRAGLCHRAPAHGRRHRAFQQAAFASQDVDNVPLGQGIARQDIPAQPGRLPALQRRLRRRRNEPPRHPERGGARRGGNAHEGAPPDNLAPPRPRNHQAAGGLRLGRIFLHEADHGLFPLRSMPPSRDGGNQQASQAGPRGALHWQAHPFDAAPQGAQHQGQEQDVQDQGPSRRPGLACRHQERHHDFRGAGEQIVRERNPRADFPHQGRRRGAQVRGRFHAHAD